MKAVVIFREKSEFARLVEQFLRDFKQRYPDKEVEILDYDSRDGIQKAQAYAIVQHPAILAVQDNGQVNKIWQGPKLPLIDELASHLH